MKKDYKGKMVKIVDNTASHGFCIGDEVKIISEQNNGCGGGGERMFQARRGRNNFNIFESDFVLANQTIADMQETIETAKKKKAGIDAEIADLEESIKFMQENKLEIFNETEFKTYQVLKTINENTSDLEKAKIIAKIIDSK